MELNFINSSLTVLASSDAQHLKESFTKLAVNKALNVKQPILFLSTETMVDDFLNIMSDATNQFSINSIKESFKVSEAGVKLNAFQYLLLASKLLIDFPDKTFYRLINKTTIDIDEIRKMIIPAIFKAKVKTIFIDKLENITAHKLTNAFQLNQVEQQQMKYEYITAMLFYMAKKLKVSFVFTMEFNSNKVVNPKISDLKYIHRNTFDMLDNIYFLGDKGLKNGLLKMK